MTQRPIKPTAATATQSKQESDSNSVLVST